MNLKKKDSRSLISELKSLVSKERKLTLTILHYLQEVDERKIYLEEAYPSLHEWAVDNLKFTDGEASRRINTMRLLKVLPEIEDQIESGALSITNASQAQREFNQENRRRRDRNEMFLTNAEKKAVVESLFNTSTREAERKLETVFPESKKDKRLSINLSDEFEAKLEELKYLMSETRYDRLIEKMADLALKKLRPKDMPTPAPASEPAQPPKNRHIPLSIRNAVRIRDGGACTFKSDTGKICGSKLYLEFEHIIPFSNGGTHSFENLTLRCRAHNMYSARKQGFTYPLKAS